MLHVRRHDNISINLFFVSSKKSGLTHYTVFSARTGDEMKVDYGKISSFNFIIRVYSARNVCPWTVMKKCFSVFHRRLTSTQEHQWPCAYFICGPAEC
jgi:hypothetical protein